MFCPSPRSHQAQGASLSTTALPHKPTQTHFIHTRKQESTHKHPRARSTRHKGRIEQLRVQLAYGFEARTQHQLSSSWQRRRKEEGRERTETELRLCARRVSRKVILCVVSFHGASICLDLNIVVHHGVHHRGPRRRVSTGMLFHRSAHGAGPRGDDSRSPSGAIFRRASE